MACTIEKVLADAKLLVNRLQEHDSAADNVIAQTQTLHRRVDAMKQYQEDINELNEIARHRPRANLIMGLLQENNQIRELQQENKELRVSLEEHQSALELIMSKYREQVVRLIAASKTNQQTVHCTDHSQEIEDKMGKICEMAAIMWKAVALDDENANKQDELIARLRTENNTLRHLLDSDVILRPDADDKETQTENSGDSKKETVAKTVRSPRNMDKGKTDSASGGAGKSRSPGGAGAKSHSPGGAARTGSKDVNANGKSPSGQKAKKNVADVK